MALESSDVFVVQKQTGGKEVRKLSMSQLQAYISAQPGVTYKGAANMTDAGDTPSAPSTGDLWLNTAISAGTWAWGAGYTGTVQTTARAIWDGAAWDVIPGSAGSIGVEQVQGSNPIEIDSTDASAPIVSVKDSTTAQVGVVTLATDTDVVNGSSNVVVTAAQLKTTNDAVASSGSGSVTSVTGVDPIEVANGTTTPAVSIKDSGFTQKGATMLSDDSVIAPTIATVAATPKYVSTYYLIQDFSTLPDA